MVRHYGRTLAFSVAIWSLAPSPVQAALCGSDQWGTRSANIDPSGHLQATITATTNLWHLGAVQDHLSCSGDFYAKATLVSGFGPSCNLTNSRHHSTLGDGTIAMAQHLCTGLYIDRYYHGGGIHWGFGASETYTESAGSVYFPRRDGDSDGYSPDDDFYGGTWEDEECDNDPSRNPGMSPACDTTNVDKNCNGVEDMTECGTPVLIDVSGNGFRLTDAASGVPFDLDGDGVAQQLSWTFAGSDDAWLTLDRNRNGTVDNGTELFGNYTPQPPSAAPNGFAALAGFDQNGDGWIDTADGVYAQLRLWTDSNHDGISQPHELYSLADAGLLRISLDVKVSERRDRYDNRYRYRAKIVTTDPRDGGPYAYDVFLKVVPFGQNQSVVPLPWLRK